MPELQELSSRSTDTNSAHSDIIERIIHVPEVDKYITCSRDTTFRIWNTSDLRHFRTLVNGLRWVNDAVYLHSQRKLCVASMDRSLTWYDVNRGSYECMGRCAAVPSCLVWALYSFEAARAACTELDKIPIMHAAHAT
jgi:WD40 repeat protein